MIKRTKVVTTMDDPNQQLVLDCLQCELLGSINAARTGHEISDELADYLVYEYVYEREE